MYLTHSKQNIGYHMSWFSCFGFLKIYLALVSAQKVYLQYLRQYNSLENKVNSGYLPSI